MTPSSAARGVGVRTCCMSNTHGEKLGRLRYWFLSSRRRRTRSVSAFLLNRSSDLGKLGGQAQVEGVAGTWADLTDNVNLMAGNLTGQVRNLADVTTAVAQGD